MHPITAAPAVDAARDARIYRLSGRADIVRDTALELIRTGGASGVALAKMSERYHALRVELADALDADRSEDFRDWVGELSTSPDLSEIYEAAANMARFVDIELGVSVFVYSRLETAVKIRTGTDQAIEHLTGLGEEAPKERQKTGQYL